MIYLSHQAREQAAQQKSNRSELESHYITLKGDFKNDTREYQSSKKPHKLS